MDEVEREREDIADYVIGNYVKTIIRYWECIE